MSVSPGFFDLLDLQRHLRRNGYDSLGLENLNRLRGEVDFRIEQLCNQAREQREQETPDEAEKDLKA